MATDTFGPFPENYYGIKYGQIFVHLASGKVWLIGVQKKSEFPIALKEFLTTYRTTYPDKDPPEIQGFPRAECIDQFARILGLGFIPL